MNGDEEVLNLVLLIMDFEMVRKRSVNMMECVLVLSLEYVVEIVGR